MVSEKLASCKTSAPSGWDNPSSAVPRYRDHWRCHDYYYFYYYYYYYYYYYDQAQHHHPYQEVSQTFILHLN